MGYWLLKSDPEEYSYNDLEKGEKTIWDGVTNNLALKHLRSLRKGDLAFIYHTGSEKQVVGIAEIVSDSYPDPKKRNPKLAVVDVKPKQRLGKPVSLEQVKTVKEFNQFESVRLPRLSVMPVDEVKWYRILQISKQNLT